MNIYEAENPALTQWKYDGVLFHIPNAPTAEQLETDAGIAALSGFLIRQYADRVTMRSRGMVSRIQLEFEH